MGLEQAIQERISIPTRRLKLPRPNGRGIFKCASSELKPAEVENVSASHDLTIGEFRVGGLKIHRTTIVAVWTPAEPHEEI